ncbi:MAG: serine/threonine-protein kinase [Bryobacteraceae bacterium]
MVHMLDAGTWNGHRYLVMELVEGSNIVAYARAAKLSIPETIRLFQELSDPIQYAHQRLVIHRDLKPGNILVTPEGRVKILDFGIARLLDGAPDDTVVHPFTLAYASPEQVRGEVLTPATDIYSLALLLYEMLAGHNPQCAVDNDETRRRALSVVPAPPTDIPDLNAIVGKALAKDPGQRYVTLADFRADLDRYLAGMPVAALERRWGYLAKRFLLRNRALSAALAAILVISSIALVNHFRATARRQRQVEHSRAMIHSVIVDLQPKLERLAGSTELRKEFIDRSVRYLDELNADAGGDPDVLADLAVAYATLASLQGSDRTGSLGDFEGAAHNLSLAEDAVRRLLVVSRSSRALRIAVRVYSDLSYFRVSQSGPAAGRPYAERAAALAAERVRRVPADYDARAEVARSQHALALTLDGGLRQGKLRESLATYRTLAKDYPQQHEVLRNISRLLKTLAANIDSFGEEALRLTEEALALDRRFLAAEPDNAERKLDVSFSLSQMGTLAAGRGDYRKAVQYMGEVRSIREAVANANPQDARALDRLGFALRNLGLYEIRAGDRPAGERDFGRGHRIAKDLDARHALTLQQVEQWARTLSDASKTLAAAGSPTACTYAAEALALNRRGGGRWPISNAEEVASKCAGQPRRVGN